MSWEKGLFNNLDSVKEGSLRPAHKVGLRTWFGDLHAPENHKMNPKGVLKMKKSDKKPRQSTYLDEYILFKKNPIKKY